MNELVRHMPESEYRAHPAVAHSDLKNMKRSPAYAQECRSHPKPSSKAMNLGTAIHMALLEPKRWMDEVDIDPQHPDGGYPAGWRNTSAYKERAAYMREAGKLLVPAADFHAVGQILDNVQRNTVGNMILDTMQGTEWSCFAYDEENGLHRKCRPDILIPDAQTAVDVKTTAVAHTAWTFARHAHSMGYYTGAPYYLDTLALSGHDFEHYLFLVVSVEPPFEVNAYALDHDSMEQGRKDYRELLAQWADCQRRGNWPGGQDGVQEVRIPQYALDYFYDND